MWTRQKWEILKLKWFSFSNFKCKNIHSWLDNLQSLNRVKTINTQFQVQQIVNTIYCFLAVLKNLVTVININADGTFYLTTSLLFKWRKLINAPRVHETDRLSSHELLTFLGETERKDGRIHPPTYIHFDFWIYIYRYYTVCTCLMEGGQWWCLKPPLSQQMALRSTLRMKVDWLLHHLAFRFLTIPGGEVPNMEVSPMN